MRLWGEFNLVMNQSSRGADEALVMLPQVLAYIVSLVGSSIKLGLIVFAFGYLLTLLVSCPCRETACLAEEC